MRQPTIRQRLASWFARDDVRNLRAKATILDRMAREGMDWQPWLSARPDILREFVMDQETLDFLTMQVQWEAISGSLQDDSTARQNTVNLSRYYYRSDPTVWRLIRIVTDFSIGRTIRVTCEDEKAQPVWDAFWTNPANRVLLSPQGIKRLSDIWLVDGEFIPVFYVAKVDGEVRVRRFPTEEIVEVLSDPDDQDAVIAYKRVWTPTNPQGAAGQRTLYYRDWRATAKDVKKLDLPSGTEWAGDNATEVSVMLGAVNTTSNRGWPWASRSMGWAQVYADFMKDRAAVASSVALWVREMKVKGGGSKGVEALRDMLRSTLATGDTETNPPPAAGSTLITNPAVDVTEKPLNTGAGDAAADSEMFANMAGSGANIAPFWLGHARSTANYATAQIIAQPMYEMFAGYTESWRGMIQDWADLVLGAWEKYGRREGMKSTEKFESHEATVYMGVPSSIPFEVLMTGLGTLAQFQAVPAKALADIALKHPAFGLEDPEKFLAPYLEEEKKKKEEEAQAQQQLGQQAPEEEPKNIVGVPGRPPAEKPEASAQGTGQGAEPEEEPTTEAQPPTCERGLSRIESEAMLEAAARVLAMGGVDEDADRS